MTRSYPPILARTNERFNDLVRECWPKAEEALREHKKLNFVADERAWTRNWAAAEAHKAMAAEDRETIEGSRAERIAARAWATASPQPAGGLRPAPLSGVAAVLALIRRRGAGR